MELKQSCAGCVDPTLHSCYRHMFALLRALLPRGGQTSGFIRPRLEIHLLTEIPHVCHKIPRRRFHSIRFTPH